MYPIVKKEKLADKIFLMDVKAPRVADACLPGQFIIAKIDEVGERIPLTICDYDREEGTITIVFQTVGASTERMSHLSVGDAFMDFVGPLGVPSELCMEENLEETKKKNIVFIAGGVTYEEGRIASLLSTKDFEIVVGGTYVLNAKKFINSELNA